MHMYLYKLATFCLNRTFPCLDVTYLDIADYLNSCQACCLTNQGSLDKAREFPEVDFSAISFGTNPMESKLGKPTDEFSVVSYAYTQPHSVCFMTVSVIII